MPGPRWQAVAALVDPVRRRLYEYVRSQDHPVTREEAADAHGISRNLTAFHLDKLIEVGLLTARYEAPGDQPRGRGRAPKVYEPVADGVSLHIPQRQYELAGQILADAVATDPSNAAVAARSHALDRGREIGSRWLSTEEGRQSARGDRLTMAASALASLGFEPRRATAGSVQLANCPFHVLAERQRELICGLNSAFVTGLLQGLELSGIGATLQPQPHLCCVVVEAV
jgi:predicted ArsR family transcriptional regulator